LKYLEERGEILKEIGDFLKSAREEKGISLDEVSDATKIPKRHLSSLEEGNFSCFSGEVYLRGALKNYAEVVGLNPKEIISGYELLLKKKKTIENGKIDEKKHKKQQLKEDNKPVVFRNRRKPLPLAALIWIFLLAIVVGGSLWYFFQQPPSENARPPHTSEPAPEENGMKENNGYIIPEEPPHREPEITIINSGSNEVVYLLSGADQKQIIMNFSGRCWVRIDQDGNLEEAIYANGDSIELGDAQETRIRLGYPAVVEIRVNGIELEGLAGIGNPIDFVIRKEN
jgi:cytoskeletal protein RodZ